LDSNGQKTSSRNLRGIILGLDPGLTVGVAILNLSGEIINVSSFKEASRAEITRHIISYGRTVLVATDVHHPPKMVKKMAASLNSKIYFPNRDLAVSLKNELVDDYIYTQDQHHPMRRSRDNNNLIPQNAHERDALAAAIQCYKKYQKKLEQIERRTQNLGLTPEIVDDIKILVIDEIPITKAINATIEKLTPSNHIEPSNLPEVTSADNISSEIFLKTDKSIKEDKRLSETLNDSCSESSLETISRLQNKLKSQEKQIKNLQKKNSIQEEYIHGYRDEISQLENKIERLQYQYSQNILQQKEIATKTAIIRGIQEKYNREKDLREDLEEQLKSIKRIRAMEISREASPVKIIDSFSRDGIREAASSRNIKSGDVVLLRSSEGGGSQTAALLVDLGVKAVITTDKMSHQAKEEFENNMVSLLEEENVDLKMVDDFAVIMTNDLNNEINKWKKNQEEKKKNEDRNKLLKIMDDYKAQRKRSSNNF
jgi:uncharacterized protein